MEQISYSLLNCLQSEVREACARLPQSFSSLDTYTSYRSELQEALKMLLTVKFIPNMLHGVEILQKVQIEPDIEVTLLAIPQRSAYVSALLYQKASETSSPAVIVCPGYGQRKQDQDVTQMGLAIARRGIAAIIPDYTGTGYASNRPDVHTDINNHAAAASLLGESDLGLRVETNRVLLSYLRGNPSIDSARIGITGLCQGAIVTWYTIALESDISACALLCGMSTYEAVVTEYMSHEGGWTGTSPYLHGVLGYGDAQHIVSCFAPKPLLVINNMVDRHWPLSGYQKSRTFLEHVYALYGSSAAEFMLLPCSHSFDEPQNIYIADFFEKHL